MQTYSVAADTAATREQVYQAAARTAGAAPSIFNTQPWRWNVDASGLNLYADRERQLRVADPDGRLMTVSCGGALYEARLALAVAGHRIDVQRMPDPTQPDLLARIELTGQHRPTPDEPRLYAAIADRHTDRRAFTAQPVTRLTGDALVAAAEGEGAHLHLLSAEQVGTLAAAASRAGELQLTDPDYRMELADWTHRPDWSGEGVPTDTAVGPANRRVPVRDFAPFDTDAPAAGDESDEGARYGLIFTDQDTPSDWLRAGEALAAVLLTAVDNNLATAPASDVTELPATRMELRRLLSGIGYPQVAVRVGHAPAGQPATAPRHTGDDLNPRFPLHP
jgi:hypothetical protein